MPGNVIEKLKDRQIVDPSYSDLLYELSPVSGETGVRLEAQPPSADLLEELVVGEIEVERGDRYVPLSDGSEVGILCHLSN